MSRGRAGEAMKGCSVSLLLVSLLVPPEPAVAGNCRLLSKQCVDGPATRRIGNHAVTRDCWQWEKEYECESAALNNACADLRSRGCYEVASTCLPDDGNHCEAWEKRYRCEAGSGRGGSATACTVATFCTDGACFDTGYMPDGDLAPAIAGLEALRQAGRYYDRDSGRFFNGEGNACREGWGGLRGCCDGDTQASTGGGDTRNQVAFAAVMSAAEYGYDYAKFKATPYVHDILAKGKAMLDGAQAATAASGAASGTSTAASAATPAFNFSFMGFGWTSGAIAETSTLGVQSTPMGNGFYFNPMAFALAAAVMVVMELSSCEPEEQQLGLKRGRGLCREVGTYCGRDSLAGCLEHKTSFCCYNSKLARLVSVQGKAQLGRGWGTPESPDCAGFTLEEFQRLDLGQMDLSEFYADIRAGNTTREGVIEDAGFWRQRAEDRFEKSRDYQTPDVSSDPAAYGVAPP